MQEVCELYKELLQFLKKYGDERITPQYKALLDAIDFLESDAEYEEKKKCVKWCQGMLYPPREGLSEFYVYNKDRAKMDEINTQLSDLLDRLHKVVEKILD